MIFLLYIARKQQRLITFIVLVSGFVFYYHLFKIQSPSRMSSKESSKILPLRNFIENFPGVDECINYATSIKNNSNTASLDQHPKPIIFIDIIEYRFPITTSKCLTNQKVFIAVISAPGNCENRKKIRETWFLHLNNSFYRFAFIVGLTENRTIQRKIEGENHK